MSTYLFPEDERTPEQDIEFWKKIGQGMAALPEPDPVPHIDPLPPRPPHGFYDLKKRNLKLYRRWVKMIKVTIDPYDYAVLYNNGRNGERGKPRPNEKDDLNFWFDYNMNPKHRKYASKFYKKLSQLSLLDLDDHCQNNATIYHTSNSKGDWALLLLDIDDKEGTAGMEDVLGVFGFLSNLFPRIYGQTSTFGKGYHGYLLVRYPDLSVEDFRVLVADLQRAICEALTREQFKSTFEIKSVPALRYKGKYKTCGQPGKFPRLATDGEIEDFLSRPAFTVAQLKRAVACLLPLSLPPFLRI